jgi:hypothetical protein
MPVKRRPSRAASSTQRASTVSDRRVASSRAATPLRGGGVAVVGRVGHDPGGEGAATHDVDPHVDALDVGLELHRAPADVVEAGQRRTVDLLDDRADAADHLRAAEEGLAHDAAWDGFAHDVTHAVLAGTGALGAIAGTIGITDEMSTTGARGDAAEDLIHRAHDAAEHARRRITAIALDGLRTPAPTPLPDPRPGGELFSERWTTSNRSPPP